MDNELKRLMDKKLEETGHAACSPSQLPRIIACPASFREGLNVASEESSIYAQKGTLKHELTHYAAMRGVDAIDQWVYEKNPSVVPELQLDDYDIEQVRDCLEYAEILIASVPGRGRIVKWEEDVNLSGWGFPEITGTADLQVYNDDIVHIVDWKFGSGVQVFAEQNDQALAYAAGVIGDKVMSNDMEIHIHIVQPPLSHFDEWVIDYSTVFSWIQHRLSPAVKEAYGTDPQYHVGEKQCRFCPIAMTCKARHGVQLINAASVFVLYQKLPDKVTPEDMSNFLVQASDLEQYIKALRLHCQAELDKGHSIPGWKLVSGRSNRKWGNEAAAEGWLMDNSNIKYEDLYTKKFKGPAAFEKLDRTLKKNSNYQTLIVKPEGKPQLTLETDPREALQPSSEAVKVFKHVKGGDKEVLG